MADKKKILPPAWATQFLHWYCKPELAEDLEGDLYEYFCRNVKSKGAVSARLIYVMDVIKFLRPYTLRKPKFLDILIQWIMLGSYIKTSGRSIVRNKLFSIINIVGLAISMSVGLLLISVYLGNKDEDPVATSSIKAGKAILETFSAPEQVAILQRGFDGDVTAGEKIIPLNGFWANEGLLKVFSFELMKGNPETALKDPFSIVLTELAAAKLFGAEDPMGKTLVFKKKSYTVSGVIKDPVFSHLRFEMLGSRATWDTFPENEKDGSGWDNVWNTWVYLLLPEGYDPKDLQPSLDLLSKKEDATVKYTHIGLSLQPLDDIMTGDNYSNEVGPVMGSTPLLIFGGLAFVVIISACFNYTNLSIARSLRRTREVGIRKVIGALRAHVISQFVVEAIIISLCALVLAGIIFLFLRPYFFSIDSKMKEILTLEITPKVLAYFLLFAVFVGTAAGFFPALFFSRINAVQVLKDVGALKVFRKLTLRKVLIVSQYCISIIFITSTIVMYRQYKHFVAFDLGFSTENILNISLQENKAELLKKEISELPEVKGISESIMVTSVGNYWGTQMKYYANPNDSAGVYFNGVDENYLPLHDHKLLAGRNFSPKGEHAEETEVIVNQQVLKRFNIGGQDPAKAIDELVRIDNKEMKIIGVIKDFHYGKANAKNTRKEVVFRYNVEEPRLLNVKILSTDWIATRAKLESIWKKIDPVHPFEARFYSEQLEEAFSGLKSTVKMASVLAFLAICISSMGLLGMVVFTTETRLKEIGIRKVLGAGEARLLFLLGKGFVLLLAIATLIGLPITVLFFEKILFPEIANHAPLRFTDMFLGVSAIMIVAILMIGTQTLKVARTNPAEVLKNE